MNQLAQAPDANLQNSLQHGIAKASKLDTFVAAVLSVCKDEYLPVSELIHKPGMAELAEDANKLSIKLSDAYTRGKLGRVPHPSGTTRYAYGKPNTEQAMMSQKAPRSTAPRVVSISANKPVRMVLQFPDSDIALSFLMQNKSVLKYLQNE